MSFDRPASSASPPHAEPSKGLTTGGLLARLRRLYVLAAVSVTLFPPAFYYFSSQIGLQEHADAHAAGIAQPIAALAAREPTLWPYNLNKVVLATAIQRESGGLGTVRVTDCAGRELLSDEALHMGSGEGSGPVGWAPVVVFGRLVAWVAVQMDGAAERAHLLTIALGALLLGLGLGLYLHHFPAREVRDQAAVLEDLLGQLRRAEARLSATNTELHARVEEAVAEVRELTERVLTAQENERERIALDLHDGLGQHLTALRLALERVARGDEARIQDALAMCDDTIADLRHAVFGLRPLELRGDGVASALRAAAERFELRTGVAAPFRHEGPEVNSPATARGLLRVLQEAMTNAVRHGGASEIGVRLRVTREQVELQVTDDGGGFDPAARPAGTGLTSMTERLRYLGGELTVEASAGRGTRVVARVPQSSPPPWRLGETPDEDT